MNILVDITFGRGTEYYALQTTSYNGIQYYGKIIDVSDMSLNIGDDHSFDVSNMTITFDDQDNHFRDMIDDKYNKDYKGNEVIIRQPDGTQIRKFFIESGTPGTGENDAKTFEFIISDNLFELNQDIIETITESYYPDSITEEAYGNVIPVIYNNNSSFTDTGIVKAWHVDKTTGNYDYLVSSEEVDTITYVEDELGNDKTATATITTYEGKYYIKFVPHIQFNYCLVNLQKFIPKSNYAVIADLMDRYFSNFGGTGFSDSNLSDWIAHCNFTGQYFAIGEQMTGQELLKIICDSFNLDWYIDGNREIQFNWLDYRDVSSVFTFNTGNMLDFQIVEYDTDKAINQLDFDFSYNNNLGEYTQSHYVERLVEGKETKKSQTRLQLRFHDSTLASNYTRAQNGYKVARLSIIPREVPVIKATATVIIETALDNDFLGQVISIDFPGNISDSARLYKVYGIDYNFTNDIARLYLYDFNWTNSVRSADKLLIHSDSINGSYLFFDDAVDGFNNITVGKAGDTSPVHSTDTSVFGATSMKFDGTNDNLNCKSYASDDTYDIASIINFTVDVWVNFSASGNVETIVQAFDDPGLGSVTDYWEIKKDATDKINFKYVKSSTTYIDVTESSAMSTGIWYHIAMVKTNNEIGVYRDGVQVLYSNVLQSLSLPIDCDDIRWGATGGLSPSNFFLGYMDETHVSHDNFFESAPNIGLTDTITPMNEPYNDFSVNMNEAGYIAQEDYYLILQETGDEIRVE